MNPKGISEIEFQQLHKFNKQMLKVLDEKENEKLSWTSSEVEIESDLAMSLVGQFGELIHEIHETGNEEQIRKRCIHVANYCMMIWNRYSSD